MREKSKRHGKHFLPVSTLCLVYVLILTGCQVMMNRQGGVAEHKAEAASTLSGAVDNAPKESDSVPSPLLDQAGVYLESGDYSKALDSVTRALNETENRDDLFFTRALDIMVHAMAHMDSSSNQEQNVMACFDGIDPSFPQDRASVRCWLSVLDELRELKSQVKEFKAKSVSQKNRIKTLESQIEQLKAVDLELGTPETEDDHHAQAP